MNIKAHLAALDKNSEIKSILRKSDYKEGTNLDINNLTVYTYYRKRNKNYFLVFEVDEDTLNMGIKMEYIQEDGNKPLTLKEYNGKKYFVDVISKDEKSKKNYATAGYKTIRVIDTNNKFLRNINIRVLSSSLAYEDYIEMINDLIKIKRSIIYDNDKKVFVGVGKKKSLFYESDEYVKIAKEIYRLSRRIFEKPKVGLKKEIVSERASNVKKFTPKYIIKKELYPYKNKYTVEKSVENINIYENRIIKYSLEKILYQLYKYKKDSCNYIYSEYKRINNTEKKFSAVEIREYNRIVEICKKMNFYDVKKEKDKNVKKIVFNINISGIDKLEKESMFENIRYIKKNKTFKWESKYFSNRDNTFIYSDEKKEYEYNAKFLKFEYETEDVKKIKYINDAIIENIGSLKFEIYGKVKLLDDNNLKKIIITIKDIKMISNGYKEIPIDNNIDNLISYIAKSNEYLRDINFIHLLKIKKDSLERTREEENSSDIENLISKIEKLLSRESVKCIKSKKVILRETQIFNSDPNYNKLFRLLKELNKKIDFLSEPTAEKYFLKTSPEIYEFWCYYKMIDILVNEMGWEIVGEFNTKDSISKVLENKGITESERVINLKHSIGEKNLYLSIYYEKRNTRGKIPDYTFEFFNDNCKSLGIAYLDAKYRNYNDQGEELFYKDIEDVSIDKYYLSIYPKPIASFIVHSHNNDKFNTYGGANLWSENPLEYKKYINKDKKMRYEVVDHKFGSFCMVPSNVDNFKKFMLLILEYKLGYINVCWNCGEDKNIQVEKALTKGKNEKIHYKCKECGEIWTENHCTNKERHVLIKHLDNYHEEQKGNKWFVICPKCFDGLNQKIY